MRTEDLYRRYVPDSIRLATLLTGDEASGQDVAHDAFVKAAAKWSLMRNPEQFGAYMRRTVVRTVLMRRRSMEREEARAERAALGEKRVEADLSPGVADRVGVADALATLPTRQRGQFGSLRPPDTRHYGRCGRGCRDTAHSGRARVHPLHRP